MKMKRISIKKTQLMLLKMCVTSLLCSPRAGFMAVLWVLCKRFSLSITHKTAINRPVDLHRREVTHILSKVSFFYWNPLIFVGYRNDMFFSPYRSLFFECYANADVRRCRSHFELGVPVGLAIADQGVFVWPCVCDTYGVRSPPKFIVWILNSSFKFLLEFYSRI